MKLSICQEPDLEFGTGGRHIDIRHGISEFGPLDKGDTRAPKELRVGLIGTQETINGVRTWLERCKEGIACKESKLDNLFPVFPGFSHKVSFRAQLVFHDRWCSPIRQREVDAVIAHGEQEETVRQAVSMFVEHAGELVQEETPMVLVCAPPHDLLAAVDAASKHASDAEERDIDESSEHPRNLRWHTLTFHDLLKAKGMQLPVPIQMVRPATYMQRQARKKSKAGGSIDPMQDEATRAWNFHTALYYKAGGIPWRLLRDATRLTSCVVGISFYQTLDRSRLLTSVAQVFNERGQGIIVKGDKPK